MVGFAYWGFSSSLLGGAILADAAEAQDMYL